LALAVEYVLLSNFLGFSITPLYLIVCFVIHDFCPELRFLKSQCLGISPLAFNILFADLFAMTVKDPTIVEAVIETAVGDAPNDATPKTEAETDAVSFERLDLPNVPTQSEVDPPIEEAVTIDAPYGLKADGTPAKKRGRKSALEGGGTVDPPQFERLDSVTQAPPLPRAKTAGNATRPSIPQPAAIATDYRAMGETAANLWFNIGETALGEDWRPNPGEPQYIAGAFTDYFRAKEIKVIDPAIVLCIALGGYTVARINKPTIKSKLGRVVLWMKSKARR
jgi:hypothetical protein